MHRTLSGLDPEQDVPAPRVDALEAEVAEPPREQPGDATPPREDPDLGGAERALRLARAAALPASGPRALLYPSIPSCFHLNLRFANRASARAPVRRGLLSEYQENEDEPNRVHISPDHAHRLALLLRHLHLVVLLLAGLAPVTSGAAYRLA